jgi:DNA-binding ferritin-like protein
MLPAEIEKLFARLVAEESALYAITRDWRYDSAGRRFLRLHALLGEQFTEIGRRLVALAACSRELKLHVSTGHGAVVASPSGPKGDALQGHMIRQLLGLHEGLIVRLRDGRAMAAELRIYSSTTELLTVLIAEHEKDAFMLRALLWEVQSAA